MADPEPSPAGVPRSFTVLAPDGLRVAVLDWGGAAGARTLVMLHPNGFCAGLFDPIARRLASKGAFHPIGVDLRGHGGTDKPEPPDPYTHEAMAADVIAVLDALSLDDVDILGGSLGGGVAVHIDRLQPGRARRLLLCEPITMPNSDDTLLGEAHPMAAAALRRKVVWPTREAMLHSYGSRPPLNQLAPEALAAYVAWGTIDRADGHVELACPPAVEAAIYSAPPARRSINAGWEHLPRLTATVSVVAGERTSIPVERFEAIAAAAGVPLVLVPGGHFFLHEDTARGVAVVEEHLDYG